MIGSSCGCGPMRPVLRRVQGTTCWRGGGGSGLGGGVGLPGQHRFGRRRFRVAGNRLGLPSWRPDQNRGLCQPPLFPGILTAHPGQTRERERNQGGPLESDIAATVSAMCDCRRACPTISQCARGVP